MEKAAQANVLYRPMMESAKELLDKERVVTLNEFEEHLFQKHHNKWKEGAYDKLEGKNRQRWENLTDHVKAQLTKQGWTQKVHANGVHYLCYTPAKLFLYGAGGGDAVMFADHSRTLHALVQRITKKGGDK